MDNGCVLSRPIGEVLWAAVMATAVTPQLGTQISQDMRGLDYLEGN